LARSYGGFIEPILHSPSVGAVYLGGVSQGSGWSLVASANGYGNDTIRFATPPANGVAVSADFNFNFVCRFDQDEAEFKNFMAHFWDLQQLTFLSVK
jgi:hypothetical protein